MEQKIPFHTSNSSLAVRENFRLSWKPEISVQFPQRPAINPCHKTEKPNPHFQTYFFKIYINIIL